MSRNKTMLLGLAVMLPVGMISPVSFGWAGNTHAKLCQRTFDDPVLQPFLSGINQSEIENWTGEPPDSLPSWYSIKNRLYIDNNWGSGDETTRLKYLTHITTDSAVPIRHAPANEVFDDFGKEAYLETQVATWDNWPNVAGTTYYTHNRSGYYEDFDGTISTIVNKFYNACLNNASWSKNNLAGFPYVHDYNDYRDAGWNGTILGLMLQRAVLVDYFLAKQSPVANSNGDYYVAPGGTACFSAVGSYDPDSINWSSNGTYYNNGGGISGYYWDFDYDGTWDWIDNDPYVDQTYDQLLARGIPTNQWVRYNFAIRDDEGKWAYDSDFLYLASGGVPEPAATSLLLLGAAAMLRRRSCRRAAGR